jgi:hypothetical protein
MCKKLATESVFDLNQQNVLRNDISEHLGGLLID